MNRFIFHVFPCISLVATAHCSSSVGPGDSAFADSASADSAVGDSAARDVQPDHTSRVPMFHRPDNSQCLTTPPAGECNGTTVAMTAECDADATCASGSNGRCTVVGFGGPAVPCMCTYDACTADATCTMGGPCACHGSPYVSNAGNHCVAGNCQVDADCGVGGYCSPSRVMGACGQLAGYYCHTATDECVDDSDCVVTSMGPRACIYQPSSANWVCAQQFICV